MAGLSCHIPNHEVTFFLLLVNESHMGLWKSNLFLQGDAQVSVDCANRTGALKLGSSRLFACLFSCEVRDRYLCPDCSERGAPKEKHTDKLGGSWCKSTPQSFLHESHWWSFQQTAGVEHVASVPENSNGSKAKDSPGSSKCLNYLEAFSQTLEIHTGVIWTLRVVSIN